MTTKFSEAFNRQFAKLEPIQKQLVIAAIELFIDHPEHKSLRNHPLGEEWAGWYSISAYHDLRLQFRMLDGNTAFFVAMGTHSQLYG